MFPPLPFAIYKWGLIALVVVLAVFAVARWDSARIDRHVKEREAEIRAEYESQARAQQDKNRDLQRAAERRYTVQAEAREHVITETIKEVRYVAEVLDACPVPVAAVRLLNGAAGCAREDRAPACAASQPLPVAR